jgi:mannose-6-phosphate isomerase-like protein (cupin superfamily)
MIISQNAVSSRRVDDALTITPLFDGKDFAFDVAKATLSGNHPTVVNRVSDRAYYFLEGTATVSVNNDNYAAKPGDLVIIKAGSPHSVRGTAKYLVITAPPFDPANEHTVGGQPCG